ncbi:TetR/AcrR family transcriptional regulator [Amycolatopsis thermoflava]|uniref:TetR/AcrR family transcriptional regulator n=1 Tax=Amycolatopsis thermoflava TaxID=84480 RepID=UPI0003FCD93F|nr:TetR/AcrR family transcriptional regulator [Amycolatopsis thermoflava]
MTIRERILDAAAQVMHARGLARTTTREIAIAAGCSEAALYKSFRSKTDLFLAVLNERSPASPASLLARVGGSARRKSVQRTLEDVTRAALEFYEHNFPIAASLFSDPQLLAAHHESLVRRGAGPEHLSTALTDFLAAQQELGAVRIGVAPEAATALLLGACFQQAFLWQFERSTEQRDYSNLARTLVRILLLGIEQTGQSNTSGETPERREDVRSRGAATTGSARP